MVEMLALMNKPCPLHEMPLGAVVPSQYFASNDAKLALQYAADMLRVFAPDYSPSPARNIDHELPTLTPPGRVMATCSWETVPDRKRGVKGNRGSGRDQHG